MSRITRLFGRGSPAEPEFQPPPQRCLACNASLEGSRSFERFRVCHACEFHFHLNALERVSLLSDPGTFKEDDRSLTSIDPLSFVGARPYRQQVIEAQRRTGLSEAALTGTARVFNLDVVMAVLDYSFLGGSIGVVAGERLTRAFERATSRKWPLVSVISTSGARIAEGPLALMQSPRIIAAAQKHREAGLPHICILTDPATGAACAGFVGMADLAIAEPGAILGYSAARQLQESAGAGLPEGAHSAEAHLARGLIDAVVPRSHLRDSLAQVLVLLQNEYQITAPRPRPAHETRHTDRPAWQLLQISRHAERPTAPEFIARMVTSFVELRGDRAGSDDPAIVAGVGSFGGETVVLIGQGNPHDGDHDGYIGAAGFRKATRAMRFADRFDLPVITLLDSPGARPSLEAEEAGLAQAIAECTATLLSLKVPTIAVIVGEGGSEAASSMGAADRVLMLDNAVYEVVSPEAAARMMLQEAGRAEELVERLRITSHDCLRLGIIDATVPEPGEGAHTDPAEAAQLVVRALLQRLTELERQRPARRLSQRYQRYRQLGSTHGWLRGRIERRLAHLSDRIGAFMARLRRQPRGLRGLRRWQEPGDESQIPL